MFKIEDYICISREICGGDGGLVAKSFLTLVTPWTIVGQAPLSMGFPRQEYWSGLPFPSLEDLSDPRIEPSSPALAGGYFTAQPPGMPREICTQVLIL